MSKDNDFENLLMATTSKLKDLKLGKKKLEECIMLRNIDIEIKKKLQNEETKRQELDPANELQVHQGEIKKTGTPIQRNKDLEVRLDRAFLVKEFLDDIVDGGYNPKLVHSYISRICAYHKENPQPKLRHQNFVKTIPQRALSKRTHSNDDGKDEDFSERNSCEFMDSSHCQEDPSTCEEGLSTCEENSSKCEESSSNCEDVSSICGDDSPYSEEDSSIYEKGASKCEGGPSNCGEDSPNCEEGSSVYKKGSSNCEGGPSNCEEDSSNCEEDSSKSEVDSSNCAENSSNCVGGPSYCEESSSNCEEDSSNCEEGSSICEEGSSNYEEGPSNCKENSSNCDENSSNCEEDSSNCVEGLSNCVEGLSNCEEDSSNCEEGSSNSGVDSYHSDYESIECDIRFFETETNFCCRELIKITRLKWNKWNNIEQKDGLIRSFLLKRVRDNARAKLAEGTEIKSKAEYEELPSANEVEDKNVPNTEKLQEREMTDKERKNLRKKLRTSKRIKTYLNNIVSGKYNNKRLTREIAYLCGICEIRKLRHQTFEPSIPKRAH